VLTEPATDQNHGFEPTPRKKTTRLLLVAVTVSCVAIIGALAIAFPSGFVHQVEISIVKQPTSYTQLFFSNPSALPGKMAIDQENKFTFTIINDENRSETYEYIVTMRVSGSVAIIRRGSAKIINGESASFTVDVRPRARRSRYQITVALVGTGQSIHFYGSTS
jgi:hypothetical protein